MGATHLGCGTVGAQDPFRGLPEWLCHRTESMGLSDGLGITYSLLHGKKCIHDLNSDNMNTT